MKRKKKKKEVMEKLGIWTKKNTRVDA
jgi:hypothetical protein